MGSANFNSRPSFAGGLGWTKAFAFFRKWVAPLVFAWFSVVVVGGGGGGGEKFRHGCSMHAVSDMRVVPGFRIVPCCKPKVRLLKWLSDLNDSDKRFLTL